jgi:transcriptional regulator with XRE-family HTH domain
MNQIERTRAGLIGGLIREARLENRLSIDDCGRVLGIGPDSYQLIEEGKAAPSLPDLEVLAMYFGVSMEYFWGSEELEKDSYIDFARYMTLRHAIIGTTLRQFRTQKGITIDVLAEITGIESEQIGAYESGGVIPYFDLEKILQSLARSVRDLTDDVHGPLAQHEDTLAYERGFERLSPEMKRFVTQDINLGYLKTAIRLSKMSADNLRKIAEGILEITY